jgi:hypothetical protein
VHGGGRQSHGSPVPEFRVSRGPHRPSPWAYRRGVLWTIASRRPRHGRATLNSSSAFELQSRALDASR